ncbi:SpaH/EbpB family LPXTG-anchored major pilin [Peptoniphilus grossensis]|uniref:SpaH/EbpB family LPXTG-anchored major pilin n=1 Tax=Peptoniphilus grossensis TaxID=1465756 RepID=UPI0040690E0A
MNKKKILSLIMALVMIVGVFSPLTAFANIQEKKTVGKINSDQISTTKPTQTEVVVHKLKADSYNSALVPAEHNGGELSKDQLKVLGTNVEELDGVTFTVYKLKDAAQLETFYKNPNSYKTKEQVSAVEGVTEKESKVTANKKGVTFTLTEDGYYWFVESDKPETVSSSIAVPFGISIPLTNVTEVVDDNDAKTHDAGTIYLKKVHVYPKNVTGDLPKVDKDVNELKQKKANFNEGDIVTWFITGDIPANLEQYKTYYLTDKLDAKLTYVGKPKVLYGTYANKAALEAEKNKIDGTTNKTGIVPESYYTITQPAENAKGGDLKLELTEEGRKALYAAPGENQPAHKLYFYFETKINEDAIMGQDIINDVTLKFINTPDGDKEKESTPEEKPRVNTGGKKFKKVIENTESPLEDAVFTIKHQKDGTEPTDYNTLEDLKWTDDLIKANEEAIKAGKFATKDADKDIYTATSASNMPQKDQIIYLRSDENGEFEIKGLEYSSYTPQEWDGKKLVDMTEVKNYYALKEVKAPADYALIEEPQKFTIAANTYYQNPDAEQLVAADPDKIGNKKLTIPQTGGIGTVIFTVVGVGLMAGAVMAMKKNREEA